MAFASAPGLIVGGAPRVNLLPRAVIEKRERAVLLRKWGVGLLAALAVVVLATVGTFTLQMVAQQRLSAENARTTELLGQVAALQPVSKKLQLEKELTQFQTTAMGTDTAWTAIFDTIRGALPANVGVISYAQQPGGLIQDDDPTLAPGAIGTITFTSGVPTDIVALIRSVRGLPGVIDADGWSNTLSGSEYQYELRVTFDQSVYTGTYAAEKSE